MFGTGVTEPGAAFALGELGQWGHLQLVRKVGEGSYGEVFHARDTWLDHPVALGVLLLLRVAYPGAWPASFGLNLVVVVGASLALGGALAGVVVPQALDTMRLLSMGNLDAAGTAALVGNVVLVIGVVCALAYFAFGAKADGTRFAPVRQMSMVGRWVLVLAFGAILGSLVTTFYAALIERLAFLVNFVETLVG